MEKKVNQAIRAQKLLQIKKVLNGRHDASKLTVIFDSREMSSKPFLREMMYRAKVENSRTIFLSWETVPEPHNADVCLFVQGNSCEQILEMCENVLKSVENLPHNGAVYSKQIIYIDTLHHLLVTCGARIGFFLQSLLTCGSCTPLSLVCNFHVDIPCPMTRSIYHPEFSRILYHVATTVLSIHSPSQVVERARVHYRGQNDTIFGKVRRLEGLNPGLEGNDYHLGVVVKAEIRHRSGRPEEEWYMLKYSGPVKGPLIQEALSERVNWRDLMNFETILLSEYKPFEDAQGLQDIDNEMVMNKVELNQPECEDPFKVESTFNLKLTDKQRQARSKVVLPYFDAQRTEQNNDQILGNIGQGGRILYDMGKEDDFDDEEDEI